jgi:hypothetical protein
MVLVWASGILNTVPTLAELASAHLRLDKDASSLIESAIEDDVRNNMY